MTRNMLSEERSRWEAQLRAEAAAQRSALLTEQEGLLWRQRRGLEDRLAAARAEAEVRHRHAHARGVS
jgi:hypothetical protein